MGIDKEVPAEGKFSEKTWGEFASDLPEKEGRYGIVSFEYTLKDGGNRDKIVFVSWAPDLAPIRQKMLYASSKDAIKKKLQGIAAEVQGTDRDEIEYNTVYNDVSSNGTK